MILASFLAQLIILHFFSQSTKFRDLAEFLLVKRFEKGAVLGFRPNDSCVRVCLSSAVACTCNLSHRFIRSGFIIEKEIAYGPYKGDDFVNSRFRGDERGYARSQALWQSPSRPCRGRVSH